MTDPRDIDAARYETSFSDARGFRQAYVRAGTGGVPLVCVHGWPESKRIFWKVIDPLAAAGFDVIAPDLRGFGDSDVAPDGFHDVFAHSADVYSLVHDVLGHDRVVLLGGDLGGPIIQDLALRYPEWVDRMVLFNSPLPFDKDRMAHLHADPSGPRGERLLRTSGQRCRRARGRARHAGRAAVVHLDVLHVAVLGAPWCVPRSWCLAGSGGQRTGSRLSHRTVR